MATYQFCPGSYRAEKFGLRPYFFISFLPRVMNFEYVFGGDLKPTLR